MTGPARPNVSAADSTAFYVCSGDTCPERDRVIWRMWADVRGNFPGYLSAAAAVLGARVELTPNFLFVDSNIKLFAIPTSAVERVALISAVDRPDGAILLIDYCDATRTVRRFWLRDAKRRMKSPLASRLSRFAIQFEAAGIARVDTGDVVPGLLMVVRSTDLQSHESKPADWSGQATISLASGDYVSTMWLVDDCLRAIVSDTFVEIQVSDIAGYTLIEDEPSSAGKTMFLTVWDDETRVDLRLRFAEEAPSVSASSVRELIELLVRRGVADLADERGPLARATLGSRRDVDRRNDGTPIVAGGGGGLFEIHRRTPHGSHRTADDFKGARETVSSRTFAVQPPQDDMLREHVAARLESLRRLRNAELISDEDWQRQRARVLLAVDISDRLFQLRALRDAGLISVEEHDTKRADLLEDL